MALTPWVSLLALNFRASARIRCASSLQGPVSIARACTKLRPVLHRDPDRVKFPRLAPFRRKVKIVRVFPLSPASLNVLLKGFFLKKIQVPPAGGLGEQA